MSFFQLGTNVWIRPIKLEPRDLIPSRSADSAPQDDVTPLRSADSDEESQFDSVSVLSVSTIRSTYSVKRKQTSQSTFRKPLLPAVKKKSYSVRLKKFNKTPKEKHRPISHSTPSQPSFPARSMMMSKPSSPPRSSSPACSMMSEFDRALLKKATHGQEFDMVHLPSLEAEEEEGSLQRVHIWLHEESSQTGDVTDKRRTGGNMFLWGSSIPKWLGFLSQSHYMLMARAINPHFTGFFFNSNKCMTAMHLYMYTVSGT